MVTITIFKCRNADERYMLLVPGVLLILGGDKIPIYLIKIYKNNQKMLVLYILTTYNFPVTLGFFFLNGDFLMTSLNLII